MRAFHLLILAGTFLHIHLVHAATSSDKAKKNFFFVEIGAYANNLKERYSAPSGYSSKVSSTKGYLRLHSGLSLGKNWKFEPSFGTMLPTRDGVDGSSSVFDSHLTLQLGIPIFSFLRFRVGPGIEWLWLLSSGKDVVLNNGTSSSTFYTPARSTHAFLMTATSGLTIRLHNRWALFLDVYVPEIMNKGRRTYHASATLGFRL